MLQICYLNFFLWNTKTHKISYIWTHWRTRVQRINKNPKDARKLKRNLDDSNAYGNYRTVDSTNCLHQHYVVLVYIAVSTIDSTATVHFTQVNMRYTPPIHTLMPLAIPAVPHVGAKDSVSVQLSARDCTLLCRLQTHPSWRQGAFLGYRVLNGWNLPRRHCQIS